MGRNSSLPTVYDFCNKINISDLIRWKYFKPNTLVSGTITFKNFNSEYFKVSIQVFNCPDQPYTELNYTINGITINYRIYFELFPSNLGKGLVWFFICPRSGKRCRKLYLIGSHFYHRSAYNFGTYQTQTLGTKDKFLVKQFDKMVKSDNAKRKLYSKNFKKHYKGKPTKQYLKLLKQIEAGGGICEAKLLMK
jgi:hypothetical protein